MKLNPASMLAVAGIDCVHFVADAEGISEKYPVRAAFVTEEAVAASRAADRLANAIPTPAWPDLRYGSVLTVKTMPDNSAAKVIHGPGQDAGIYLDEVDGENCLGFTGSLMADCRWRLTGKASLRSDISHRDAMLGLLFVQELIASDPDPEKYPLNVIRDAFLCSMSLSDIRAGMTVSDEEFVRKARSDLVRAMISRLDPAHPDALQAKPVSLDVILGDFGLNDLTASDATHKAMGEVIGRDRLKSMIRQSKGLSEDVFGVLTRTPVEEISCGLTDAKGFSDLCDELTACGAAHGGDWSNAVRRRIDEVLASRMPDYRFEMALGSLKGQDILGIQDKVGGSRGNGYLYAWPTADRLPAMRIGTKSVLSLSKADIPTATELNQLQATRRSLSIKNIGRRPESVRQPEGIASES